MKTDFLDEVSRIGLKLEELYYRFGYSKFKMNRFEPYSFYMSNESFLEDNRVITMQSATGKLLALKPDVTMSIVKNHKAYDKSKIYYNEPVFKVPPGESDFREIRQVGLEYIGELSLYQTLEVLNLAIKSLAMIGEFRFVISDMSIVNLLFDEYNINAEDKNAIIRCLRQKNLHDLEKLPQSRIFTKLVQLPADFKEAITVLLEDETYACCKSELDKLMDIAEVLVEICDINKVMFDFAHLVGTQYYNGLTFTGYVRGVANKVLSGGRYDNLLRNMGEKTQKAIGFAVYLSEIENTQREVCDKQIIQYTNVVETLKKANELYESGINFCVRKEENDD